MTEPIKCTEDNCDIVVKAALFNGFFLRCETCKKTAGIATTKEGAVAVWNQWVEIGGFIKAKERTNDPRPGFLTWLNDLADLLPAGTVIGVKVETLREWFEAGMTAEGAADEVALRQAQDAARRGQRVKETG